MNDTINNLREIITLFYLFCSLWGENGEAKEYWKDIIWSRVYSLEEIME